MDDNLQNEVFDLINQNREGAYWDFKEKYHTNKARLLHDIICLANNIDNRDAYLIMGVTDSGEIRGIEKDVKRKNQEEITSFLSGKRFASGFVPYVILETLLVYQHEVDILIIKKSKRVPYYLEERFSDGKSYLSSGSIYTRIEDRNTPINSTADPIHTELLWKIRFGLVPNPLERLKSILLNKDEWEVNGEGYYFSEAPEFTIKENTEVTEGYENYFAPFYAYHQTNSKTSYYHYECKYHNTILYERQTISLDSGRYHTPVPEKGFINSSYFNDNNMYYRYFIKGTTLYNFHLFLFDEKNEEAYYARKDFLDIVLIYNSEKERIEFETYIIKKFEAIREQLEQKKKEFLVFDLNDKEQKREKELVNERIHIGKLLVEELEKFRVNNIEV